MKLSPTYTLALLELYEKYLLLKVEMSTCYMEIYHKRAQAQGIKNSFET